MPTKAVSLRLHVVQSSDRGGKDAQDKGLSRSFKHSSTNAQNSLPNLTKTFGYIIHLAAAAKYDTGGRR